MAKKSDKPTIDTAPPPKASVGSKSSWKMLDRGSTIVSGLLAQRVAMVAWRGVTGRKPPVNGRHPDVGSGEAIAWAMVGGALVEVVKIVVRRGASTYWIRSTGHLPPGMKPLKQEPSKKK
ncbi:MAG: DUF4235 domain-containing protein [Aeromicrobium sp.]